jgi:hypothetical protein
MKKLWISLAAVVIVSFLVLGWIGTRIHEERPPMPARIVDTTGSVVVADGDIGPGQNIVPVHLFQTSAQLALFSSRLRRDEHNYNRTRARPGVRIVPGAPLRYLHEWE